MILWIFSNFSGVTVKYIIIYWCTSTDMTVQAFRQNHVFRAKNILENVPQILPVIAHFFFLCGLFEERISK